MGIYEVKMHIKRLKIVKKILHFKRIIKEKENEEELKKHGLELMGDVEKALKNYGIVYFVDFGTLLGIIREHNFISWDLDIDYGIMISSDFDWNLFEAHMNESGFLKIRQFKYAEKIREQTYKKGTVSIDFLAHNNDKKNSYVFGFFRKEGFIYHSSNEFHVRVGKFAKIVQTKKVIFLGIEVTVPENAEEYLESIYSANWRIPDPDWSEETNPNRTVLEELGHGIFYN